MNPDRGWTLHFGMLAVDLASPTTVEAGQSDFQAKVTRFVLPGSDVTAARRRVDVALPLGKTRGTGHSASRDEPGDQPVGNPA